MDIHHDLASLPAGDKPTYDMDLQADTIGVARHADQAARQFEGEAQPAIVEIEVQFLGVFLINAFGPAPDPDRTFPVSACFSGSP